MCRLAGRLGRRGDVEAPAAALIRFSRSFWGSTPPSPHANKSDVPVTAAVMGFATFPKSFRKLCSRTEAATTCATTVPVLTLVVHMTDGTVDWVMWDETPCNACGLEQCVATGCSGYGRCRCGPDGTCDAFLDKNGMPNSEDGFRLFKECAAKDDECAGKTDDEGRNPCDLRVYLAWDGTDKNGQVLKSSGLRLSRFKSYSAKNIYQSSRREFK